MKTDGGTASQEAPLVHGDLFHFVRTMALLLLTGRSGLDPVDLDVDATHVDKDGHFVSSFEPSTHVSGVRVSRAKVLSTLYVRDRSR